MKSVWMPLRVLCAAMAAALTAAVRAVLSPALPQAVPRMVLAVCGPAALGRAVKTVSPAAVKRFTSAAGC